ncbi:MULTISPECIES: hypothetical protein [unclassified Sphingomonas]|uniref:hypothetical protein n=1 Tax=unclassified Sphingomonas TaxID=196159 RepID=UPI00082CEB31|nr:MULTISPECIES: hypothetical protein [unclassified Sphingomonas]
MTHGAAELATLCRLRARELDRARDTLAAASAHHAACEAAVTRLELTLRDQHVALDAARAARCRAPADEMIRLSLDRRESELHETQALYGAAIQRRADAATALREARAGMLRAQAREEAVAGLHHRALRDERRRRDRHAENEREDHRRRA